EVRCLARLLHDANPVQGHAGPADEGAARLEDHLRRLARPRVREPGEERADELGDRRRAILLDVPDAEPAAEVDDSRLPAELGTGASGERAQPVDGLERRARVEELGADV